MTATFGDSASRWKVTAFWFLIYKAVGIWLLAHFQFVIPAIDYDLSLVFAGLTLARVFERAETSLGIIGPLF